MRKSQIIRGLSVPGLVWGLGAVWLLCQTVGCGGSKPVTIETDGPGSIPVNDATPDAIPRVEPRSRYGNPKSYVVFGKRYHTLESSQDYVEQGIASWYGKKFHGRRTSSGEPYDMYAMTAAHKSLPLPTYVKVRNLENGQTVILRVNDRGPFHGDRIIDLSYAAAVKLGIARNGTGLVEVRALDPSSYGELPANVIPKPPQAAVDSEVFIQVGAFSNLQNAENFCEQLKDYKLGNVEIHSVSNQKRTIYRVKIGPLASVTSVDQTAQQLERLGLRDYRVLVKQSSTQLAW